MPSDIEKLRAENFVWDVTMYLEDMVLRDRVAMDRVVPLDDKEKDALRTKFLYWLTLPEAEQTTGQ